MKSRYSFKEVLENAEGWDGESRTSLADASVARPLAGAA